MNAVVTNDHHFVKGIILTIKDGVSTWSVDQQKQENKHGPDVVFLTPPKFTGEEVIDPVKSIDDFVKLLSLVFEFTGTIANEYTHNVPDALKIVSDEDLSQWDIVKHIYNTPLKHEFKFIRESHCGCNMGHCGALVGVDIDDKEYKTYGDVMCTFAFGYMKDDDGNGPYWIYPDSVGLGLEKVSELPKKVYSEATCYSEQIDLDLELDPDTIYLAWSYGR